jgi:hypothetical protein
MKDETNGVPILEFVGLRSKIVLLDDRKEKKTGKGIKKYVLKKTITHEEYKTALFSQRKEEQRKSVKFKDLRSISHKIYLTNVTKIGLSCFVDAYGHYKITSK